MRTESFEKFVDSHPDNVAYDQGGRVLEDFFEATINNLSSLTRYIDGKTTADYKEFADGLTKVIEAKFRARPIHFVHEIGSGNADQIIVSPTLLSLDELRKNGVASEDGMTVREDFQRSEFSNFHRKDSLTDFVYGRLDLRGGDKACKTESICLRLDKMPDNAWLGFRDGAQETRGEMDSSYFFQKTIGFDPFDVYLGSDNIYRAMTLKTVKYLAYAANASEKEALEPQERDYRDWLEHRVALSNWRLITKLGPKTPLGKLEQFLHIGWEGRADYISGTYSPYPAPPDKPFDQSSYGQDLDKAIDTAIECVVDDLASVGQIAFPKRLDVGKGFLRRWNQETRKIDIIPLAKEPKPSPSLRTDFSPT
jgi:hypothetical protein